LRRHILSKIFRNPCYLGFTHSEAKKGMVNGMAETRLGLPGSIHACLFDLDGVLTETATLHAKAWQRMFDDFLSARARLSAQPFVPFDVVRDYDLYVDGEPRDDGTRSFLASRGIPVPEGTDDDPATAETVRGSASARTHLARFNARTGRSSIPGFSALFTRR